MSLQLFAKFLRNNSGLRRGKQAANTDSLAVWSASLNVGPAEARKPVGWSFDSPIERRPIRRCAMKL